MLVPLLTLGLPSSATAAVLLAAFQQYGLQPGPLLFSSRPDLVWTLIASLYIGNVMLLVLNLPLVGVWARVMLVPRPLLFGGILVLASLGAYSLNRSMLDLGAAVRRRARSGARCACTTFRSCPAVLGLVLGPLAEQQFRRAMAISEGDLSVFVTRPIARGAAAAGGRRRSSAPWLLKRWSRSRSWYAIARMTPDPSHELRRRRARRRQRGAVRRAHRAAGRAPACVVLECAPRDFRGGNSRHTRNLRCAHAAPTDVLTDAYSEDEFMSDLLRVNGGETDEPLARLVDRALGRRARRGWRSSASASRRRCAARCTWRAPTRSFSAAARR